MNVLFLIGNGFDINAGLKTSAKELVQIKYKEYLDGLKQDKGSDFPKYLTTLHESIENKIENWSDVEMALGDLTARYNEKELSETDFLQAFDNLREKLAEYLLEEVAKTDQIKISESVAQELRNNILNYMRDGLNRVDRLKIDSFQHGKLRENINVSFVNFNYTILLERILRECAGHGMLTKIFKPGQLRYVTDIGPMPFHIHGEVQSRDGIIIGVNDEKQIAAEPFRLSADLTSELIKPTVNDMCGEQKNELFKKYISDSTIIIIFGMSLGATDAIWWKEIAQHLLTSANTFLIIGSRIDKEGYISSASLKPKLREQIKTKFLKSSGIDESEWENIQNNILISLDSEIFKLLANIVEDPEPNSI